MLRRALLALLSMSVLFSVVGLGSSASADSYPPSGVRVVAGVVSAASVADGESVRFSGDGFKPASTLRLSVDGQQTQVLTAGGDGAFAVDVVLTGAGAHALAASGLEPNGRVRVVTATVTVRPSAPGSGGGGLPFTGGTSLVLALLVGLVLVTLGAGALVMGRYRHAALSRG